MHTRDLKTRLGAIGISRGSPNRLSPLLRTVVFLATFFVAFTSSTTTADTGISPEGSSELERHTLNSPAATYVEQPPGASETPDLGDLREGREAMFRVAHLSPDAPEVDVYVDDEAVDALTDVPFKSVSSYLPLSAGTRNVKVYLAGASVPLLEADVELDGDTSYTLGVVGRYEDGSLAAKLYKDDNSPPTQDRAKLRVIYAVPEVRAATVRVEGDEKDLFTIPGFSNASNYGEITPGNYDLEVTKGTAEAVLNVPGITFSAGEVHTVFAVGSDADNSRDIVLTVDSRGGGTTGDPYKDIPQDNKEKLWENHEQGAGGGTAVTPESDEGEEVGSEIRADESRPIPYWGTLPPFTLPVPPVPAAESADNNLPNVATPPTSQESIYEGAAVVSTTPAALEPIYQQPLYQEEPFVAAPVETEPAYQQPTDDGLTVQSMSVTTMPNTVDSAPAEMLYTLSGGGYSATAMLDAAPDDCDSTEKLL